LLIVIHLTSHLKVAFILQGPLQAMLSAKLYVLELLLSYSKLVDCEICFIVGLGEVLMFIRNFKQAVVETTRKFCNKSGRSGGQKKAAPIINALSRGRIFS